MQGCKWNLSNKLLPHNREQRNAWCKWSLTDKLDLLKCIKQVPKPIWLHGAFRSNPIRWSSTAYLSNLADVTALNPLHKLNFDRHRNSDKRLNPILIKLWNPILIRSDWSGGCQRQKLAFVSFVKVQKDKPKQIYSEDIKPRRLTAQNKRYLFWSYFQSTGCSFWKKYSEEINLSSTSSSIANVRL